MELLRHDSQMAAGEHLITGLPFLYWIIRKVYDMLLSISKSRPLSSNQLVFTINIAHHIDCKLDTISYR